MNVSVSASEIASYRNEVADLEARGARDGLTPSEVTALAKSQAGLATIDAAAAAAAAAGPAAPPLPADMLDRVSPEKWNAFHKANGRAPNSAGEVLTLIASTAHAARLSRNPYSLSNGGSRGIGI